MDPNETFQRTQKWRVKPSRIGMEIVDRIVRPRRPVPLEVLPTLVSRCSATARVQDYEVPWEAPLKVSDDLPENREKKQKKEHERQC